MIMDSFSDIRKYAPLLPHLDAALQAIKDVDSLAPGKYFFDGGFFLLQKDTTIPMSVQDAEAHRKYIDLQIMLEGCEEIAWEHLNNSEVIEYREDIDKVLVKADDTRVIRIDAGMCWVAFPTDVHKAGAHTDTPHTYRKIVVKLAID